MHRVIGGLTSYLQRLRPGYFLALAGVIILQLAGLLEPLDRFLLQQRFELSQRAASGGLVIVEVDARSLHELDVWPWPRRHHAELIDRLLAAGARQIVLDVDFSARSASPEDDRILADAIRRAGDRLVLPTFMQAQRALSSAQPLENRPHSVLRGATRLGTANVQPESDGLIWRYPVAVELPSGFRPSLGVYLAGSGVYDAPDFILDYGIRAATLTRVSFVDVLRGNVPADTLRGRDVLVGSTAAELGDYLAVPIYRALPGVLIHALAYESAVQGRMIQRTGLGLTLAGLVVLLLTVAPLTTTGERTWPWTLAAAAGIAGAIMAVTFVVHDRAGISVDIAAWLAALTAFFLLGILRLLRQQAIILFRQRMAQTHMRALMRAVVEDSFDGIIITNGEGRIELANRAAGNILQRPAESMTGMTVDVVLPGVARDGAGDPAKRDLSVRREDGSLVPLEVVRNSSSVRRSRRLHERRRHDRRVWIYTFRDISERQRTAAAQQAALEAAVAASRAKSEFLANMSHELRTPLNAIIGFSETMQEKVFGPLGNRRYEDYVQDIGRSGRHLLAIIDQVLDVSRIEAGAAQIREDVVSLADVVGECESIMQGWLHSHPRVLQTFVASGVPLVRADPQMLRQILLNLLSNAIKFTNRHGLISVRVTMQENEGPVLEVTDNGVGIPAGKLEQVTQAFFQVDSTASGTGLGLYLVRHFVEIHGGTLVIASADGIGTTARVTLPRDRVIVPGEGAEYA